MFHVPGLIFLLLYFSFLIYSLHLADYHSEWMLLDDLAAHNGHSLD
jgi:hypothetical protein